MRIVHPCRYMGKGLVLEEETVGFFRDFFFNCKILGMDQ